MPTYDTLNYQGIIPTPTKFHGSPVLHIPVRETLARLTLGVAIGGGDVIRVAWLPPGFVVTGAKVSDPDEVLATFDLGFAETIAGGYEFDATNDEIIDAGDTSAAGPVLDNKKTLVKETPKEYPRPIHLKVLTVGGAPPTEGLLDILIFMRPANTADGEWQH